MTIVHVLAVAIVVIVASLGILLSLALAGAAMVDKWIEEEDR